MRLRGPPLEPMVSDMVPGPAKRLRLRRQPVLSPFRLKSEPFSSIFGWCCSENPPKIWTKTCQRPEPSPKAFKPRCQEGRHPPLPPGRVVRLAPVLGELLEALPGAEEGEELQELRGAPSAVRGGAHALRAERGDHGAAAGAGAVDLVRRLEGAA